MQTLQIPVLRRLFSGLRLLCSLALVLTIGCTKPIGETCKTNGDCASGVCSDSVCTKACTKLADCPLGYECRTGQDQKGLCLAPVATGGYGTDCAVVSGGCTNEASPCAAGFTCYAHAGLKCDADAYCTTECQSDDNCPTDMFCGTEEYQDSKGNKQTFHGCMKRTRCSDCTSDSQCPTNYVCGTDTLGGHFCGKTCRSIDDCLKPFKAGTQQYDSFEDCVNIGANGLGYCRPQTGACHGKSAISSIMGDGQICSPCRVGEPSDCAMGLGCIQEYTGERFCTQGCTITLTFDNNSQNWNLSNDSCPSGTACFFGAEAPIDCYNVDNANQTYTPKASCMAQGWCNGDKSYAGDSCYPPN